MHNLISCRVYLKSQKWVLSERKKVNFLLRNETLRGKLNAILCGHVFMICYRFWMIGNKIKTLIEIVPNFLLRVLGHQVAILICFFSLYYVDIERKLYCIYTILCISVLGYRVELNECVLTMREYIHSLGNCCILHCSFTRLTYKVARCVVTR